MVFITSIIIKHATTNDISYRCDVCEIFYRIVINIVVISMWCENANKTRV